MAYVAERTAPSGPDDSTPGFAPAAPGAAEAAAPPAAALTTGEVDREKVLPLPAWLRKAYYIFPVVLYIPDAIFNYFVYSHGGTVQNNWVLQACFTVLWGFLSLGVVGMAYLLSVLAPWHWGQGHRIQAFFCGVGVVIATAITTWNSLAYRSQAFTDFPTDQWVYAIWPQLRYSGFSLTMVLVAIAPPFWGLFWAIVQPTETGRNLRQLQESHQERLLRMQQEAELKRLKAETNAKIREAQLRGMAQTVGAARDQASGFLAQRRKKDEASVESTGEVGNVTATTTIGEMTAATRELAPSADARDEGEAEQSDPHLVKLPEYALARNGRELNDSRGMMFNHAASASSTLSARMEPAATSRSAAAQPPLMRSADVQGAAGLPATDVLERPRQPAVLGGINAFFPQDGSDVEAVTGTTGPHTAIRRSPQLGSLTQQLNGPSRTAIQAIEESWKELTANNKRASAPELTARVAQRLGVSEAAARQAIKEWRDLERNKRRQ